MKDSREGASLVRSGSEFQILGAAALNALEPMLVLTCGCAKSCCPCERNAREGTYGCIKIAKYAGELCCRSLNVSVAILKSMRCLTGSQCKVWSASDERVWLGSTSLARVFWILWSLLRLACEVPGAEQQ